jgi:hypothetical protein
MTLDDFFLGYENSRPLFEAVRTAIDNIGPTELRISKGQIAFWRRKAVARVWIPARYLGGSTAPLVLTVGLHSRDTSHRWKEIVEPVPGRFTHHLELYSTADMDEEVRNWLRMAWVNAA